MGETHLEKHLITFWIFWNCSIFKLLNVYNSFSDFIFCFLTLKTLHPLNSILLWQQSNTCPNSICLPNYLHTFSLCWYISLCQEYSPFPHLDIISSILNMQLWDSIFHVETIFALTNVKKSDSSIAFSYPLGITFITALIFF